MSNTSLWNEVFVTDPKSVKPITGKPYQGNSPKPYWLIQRATETFGPIGIGWGVTVKSERFERITDDDVLHVAVVSVWFVRTGTRSETFDQMGGTKACYRTRKGELVVDEDAGKKSVTDGMVKCLSMIGFAGDIFSGQWDDSKYVEWAGEQYKIAARPKDEDLDLTEESLSIVKEIAKTITTMVENGKAKEAVNYYKAAGIVDDMHIAFQNNIDSKTRTALKKAQEEMKGK